MKQISLFFILACLAGCFGTEPQKTGLEGKPMPDFSLLLPDSSTWINSRNIATGKPIAIFSFSPYCAYCRSQTKEIVDDMEKLKDIQFYFVTTFPLPTIREYCNEYQLSKYPNITVGLDTADAVGNYFETPGVPYMAVYGKDKTLNKTFLGKVYSGQIKKAAEE